MNKIHRVLWNKVSNTFVAVSETAVGRGKSSRSASDARSTVLTSILFAGAMVQAHAAPVVAVAAPQKTAVATAVSALPSNALPTGGNVTAGQASIQQPTGGANPVLNINQTSDRATINWNSFNVGANGTVNFNQPSAQSATLNRVTGTAPSQIFGRINAPGQVFVLNPNGVLFGASAQIDVGGLVATTYKLSDADFMAAKAFFQRDGSTASVVNQGNIHAAIAGYAALLAPEVRNEGIIIAKAGTVALASGEAVLLQFEGSGLVGITVTPSTIASLVSNQQAVIAPGGLVIFSAKSVPTLTASVVNSGTVVATGAAMKNGRIVLESSDQVVLSGNAQLDTSNTSGVGGNVTITGDRISLNDSASINASGSAGGGSVLVGGDLHGEGTMQQAKQVDMAAGASIDASATQKGNGGKVVLWSDIYNDKAVTTVAGSITSKGGAQGGDGGIVETSGHTANIGTATVKASAAKGTAGTWLIDPSNYIIDQTAADYITAALNAGTSVVINTNSNASATTSQTANTNNTVQGNANSGSTTMASPGSQVGQYGGATGYQVIDPKGGDIEMGSYTARNAAGNRFAAGFNINYTGSGNVSLTFAATRDIYFTNGTQNPASSITATGTGALNVIFNSGTNNPTGGATKLYNLTVNTNGGYFKVGGGAAMDGNSPATNSQATYLKPADAAGNIVPGSAGDNLPQVLSQSVGYTQAVTIYNTKVDTTNAAHTAGGIISILGRNSPIDTSVYFDTANVARNQAATNAQSGNGYSSRFIAVGINQSSFTTGGSGTINIVGDVVSWNGAAPYMPAMGGVGLTGTTLSSQAGKISVSGISDFNNPLSLNSSTTTGNTVIKTTGGDVALSGVNKQIGAGGGGVIVSGANVSTLGNGAITVTGTGGSNGLTPPPAQTYGAISAHNGDSAGGTGITVSGTGNSFTTNNGNITFTGTGGTNNLTLDSGIAMNFGSGTISAGGSGAVTLTGTGGTYATNATVASGTNGVNVGMNVSTAGGPVTITGTGGTSPVGNNAGVRILGTVGSSTTGPVTVTGVAGASFSDKPTSYGVQIINGSIYGGKTGVQENPSQIFTGGIVTGNKPITINADSYIQASQPNLTTGNAPTNTIGIINSGTSTTTFQNITAGTVLAIGDPTTPALNPLNGVPTSLGAAPTLQVTLGEMNAVTANTVVIGSGTAAPITIANSLTPTGATASFPNLGLVSGGGITIGTPTAPATLSATSTLMLTAGSGSIVTAASAASKIIAPNLLLNGQGASYNLTSPLNNVGTLAVTGGSLLNYVDTDNLTIGPITNPVTNVVTPGISASGTVSVLTLKDNLTVTGPVITTSSATGAIPAIQLNAGKNFAPNTGLFGGVAGGNLIIGMAGNPFAGNTGAVRLYSGTVSGSGLGLSGLPNNLGGTAGSSTKIFNSDETTATTTTTPAGITVIYRGGPTS